MPHFTSDDLARAIIEEGKTARTTGPSHLRHPVISPRGCQIGIATGLVETNLKMYANRADPESMNFPHDAVGSDANSVGVFQQRAPWWGTVAERMNPRLSAAMFFNALARLDYNGPKSPGWYAQQVQQSAFPTRYDERFPQAVQIYERLAGTTTSEPENPLKPSYNEFPIWSANTSSRGNTKPRMFLLHTQEGGGGDAAAENLANWFKDGNGVSYHYTVSQASDGGVTVVDCVDTDRTAWSVGNANPFSINLCFAGSRAAWTREQWLKHRNAIEVAAWLAVEDAKKYGFSTRVVPPPYTNGEPGISDHRWVTDVFKWGNHTDVGPNFPWDVLAAAVAKYAADPVEPETPAEPEPQKVKRFPEDWSDRDLLVEIVRQLRGYNLKGWTQLGGRTLIDAVAELLPDVSQDSKNAA